MDTELRDKLLIRVGVLHKSTPCEAITARLVVDTILPIIQQEITKARLNEAQALYEDAINSTSHGHITYARKRVERHLETLANIRLKGDK